MSSKTQFKILIKIGDQVQSFMIDKKLFTIGRSKTADLQIPCDYLSNQHLRFEEIEKNTFTITDLGSTNGTWLKNVFLTPQKPVRYESGNEILIKVQGGVRLKILPVEMAIPDLPVQSQESYLAEKKYRQEEMAVIEEKHRNEVHLLKEEIDKITLEKMDENLKIVLIKEELGKLEAERAELKEIVETQYKALKLISQKTIETEELLITSEKSLHKVTSELSDQTLEYTKQSLALDSVRTEYDKLKHATDILNAETKKLVAIYQTEKEQFDSVMEEKRKNHMEELNKQLESYNDEFLKKKTELDYLKTEYELKHKAFDENLRRYEQKEKEKTDLELKRQTAQMTTELLYYRSELKNIEKHYKNKLREQELALEAEKIKATEELEINLRREKDNRLKQIVEETSELEKIKLEKSEMLENVKSLRADWDKQISDHKDFLTEMNRQKNEAIATAEGETDKEIRTMKFKKVQELSDQISQHIAKDLTMRRGRALDDEYIEKSSIAIKRLIVEKMLESHDVDTERTRQLVLGDELKKFKTQKSSGHLWSMPIVASVALFLFLLLSMSVFFPEKVLDMKNALLERESYTDQRMPASQR